MPDFMFSHAAAGYGGHGTLCGALGVCSCIINLVVYDKDETYRDTPGSSRYRLTK